MNVARTEIELNEAANIKQPVRDGGRLKIIEREIEHDEGSEVDDRVNGGA